MDPDHKPEDFDKEGSLPKPPISEEPASKKKFDEISNLRFSRSQKKETKSDDIISFIKENTKEAVTYVVIIAGLLMMLFDGIAVYGGVMLGILFGVYFSKELAFLMSNANRMIEEEGLPKSLVFGTFLLVVLFKIPFFFIGAVLVAAMRVFFVSTEK